MPKTTRDLGLKTSIQTFYALARCTLMGNQPWPQLQNGIRERPISNSAGFHIKLYEDFAKFQKVSSKALPGLGRVRIRINEIAPIKEASVLVKGKINITHSPKCLI